MEYAWKNVSAWNNLNEANRSPSAVQFLYKVNVSEHISEPTAKPRLSLPRFFHYLLHSALSYYPFYRETI